MTSIRLTKSNRSSTGDVTPVFHPVEARVRG
jgi:hypothetical protein